MKRIILYAIIFLSLFSQLPVAAAPETNEYSDERQNIKTAYMSQKLLKEQLYDKSKEVNASLNTILPHMEFDTVRLEKGRKFVVISDRNLNNNNINGIPVKFESVQKEYLAYDKSPSKIIFQGIVEKTERPRLAGKSGTVKIKLEKITVDKITYPVSALISKIDNKNVYFNTLSGAPCYLSNLANAANEGVIHSSLKDPCTNQICTNTSTFSRPFVFLGAAALQTADLLLSPFSALAKRGNDVSIPLNTYFEIKLDKDMYVLNI